MSFRKAALALAVVGFAACQVEKTQDGELPEVKVEGGQLPKYEVKGSDDTDELKLRMDSVRIPVPKLERVPDTIPD
jgi:hypothetical protein